MLLTAVAFSFGLLSAANASAASFKLKESFGSAAEPSFLKPMAVALDHGSGDLLVVDAQAKTISRFNSDGTPDNFSALGTNVIDGTAGGADETPAGDSNSTRPVQKRHRLPSITPAGKPTATST